MIFPQSEEQFLSDYSLLAFMFRCRSQAYQRVWCKKGLFYVSNISENGKGMYVRFTQIPCSWMPKKPAEKIIKLMTANVAGINHTGK
jgi:hypothetical protein